MKEDAFVQRTRGKGEEKKKRVILQPRAVPGCTCVVFNVNVCVGRKEISLCVYASSTLLLVRTRVLKQKNGEALHQVMGWRTL